LQQESIIRFFTNVFYDFFQPKRIIYYKASLGHTFGLTQKYAKTQVIQDGELCDLVCLVSVIISAVIGCVNIAMSI